MIDLISCFFSFLFATFRSIVKITKNCGFKKIKFGETMDSKLNQIIELLGNLTVEEKEQLSSLLSAPKSENENEVEIEIATPTPVAPAPEVKSISDLRTRGMKKAQNSARKSPKTPFGTTPGVRRDGSTYQYRRSAFDGHETSLPKDYMGKKNWFITFSRQCIDCMENFHGAGDVSIAMTNNGNEFPEFEELFKKYGSKEGKLFFRWDNGCGHTTHMIDLIYPILKERVAELMEEGEQ